MACPHRDHHIGPALDVDTVDVLGEALAALARRHTPAYWLDGPCVTLYLLAGLYRQIQAGLPAAVARAAACNRYGSPRPIEKHLR